MTYKLLAAAAFLSAALLLGSCGKSAADSDVSAFAAIDGDYLKTGGDGSNWAMTGFNYDEQRHSPLKLINDSNVQDLGIAWFADLPDARGQEATPVVVDGKMFVSTAWSKVFAYDAKTGKPLWSFDPEVDKARGVKACCDVVNRGVAFWKGSVSLGCRLCRGDQRIGAKLASFDRAEIGRQSRFARLAGNPALCVEADQAVRDASRYRGGRIKLSTLLPRLPRPRRGWQRRAA